jgi:hypothetical protein
MHSEMGACNRNEKTYRQRELYSSKYKNGYAWYRYYVTSRRSAEMEEHWKEDN